MNRNLKIISILMVLVLCLSFSASAAGDKVKTKDQIIREKISNKDFVKYQQWHDKNKFDREVAGSLNLKVQSTKNKVPDGFEPAPDGYQTMVSYKNNGKIHIRDTEHKVETIQVPWDEILALPGFDGETVLITHYNDLGIKDGVWVQSVYNIDGFAYLEEIPFSEVVVSGFTGIYQFTPAGNFTASDTPGIGYTFDSDFVNYFNASFETIYDDTNPYPQFSTTNLVAWYRMDEGFGTAVNDSSGNDINGTAINGMGWTDGQIEGAGLFDGTDDYVDCTGNSAFNITSDLTIIAWIAPNDYSTLQKICGNHEFNVGGYELRIDSDKVNMIASYSGSQKILSHPVTINDKELTHVVGVMNSTGWHLYINGNHAKSDLSLTYPDTTSNNFTISRTGVAQFEGMIDNVMLYNRAFSESEISTNYQIGYNEYFSKDNPYDIPSRGLVGWWRFDEGSGTNVSDSSGNGNHGTSFNGMGWENGKYNSGGNFTSGPYVTIDDTSLLNDTDEFTICADIVAREQSASYRGIISKETGNEYNIVIRTTATFDSSNTQIEFRVSNGTTKGYSTNINNNKLYNVMLIHTSEPKAYVYVNNELLNSFSTDGIANMSQKITFGALSFATGNAFNGTIDNVVIYDRSLSDEERNQLYYIKTEQLKTRTNSNSTYSGLWNDSTDNPISVPFGAGESISSLRFDDTSSIVQNGITIYEPENMLFNLSVEVGHTENTTLIREIYNTGFIRDTYELQITHIPGVDSVDGEVTFTADPNPVIDAPGLTLSLESNNPNATVSYNSGTRTFTIDTGPVIASTEYTYTVLGVNTENPATVANKLSDNIDSSFGLIGVLMTVFISIAIFTLLAGIRTGAIDIKTALVVIIGLILAGAFSVIGLTIIENIYKTM